MKRMFTHSLTHIVRSRRFSFNAIFLRRQPPIGSIGGQPCSTKLNT